MNYELRYVPLYPFYVPLYPFHGAFSTGTFGMDVEGRVIEICSEGGVTVVMFLDRHLMVEDRVAAVGEALDRLVEAGPTPLVFDFSRVEYVSSALLGKLLGVKKTMAQRLGDGDRNRGPSGEVITLKGPGLPAGGPQGPVFRSRVFEIYPDRPSAIAAVAESGPAHGWIALCGVRPALAMLFRVC